MERVIEDIGSLLLWHWDSVRRRFVRKYRRYEVCLSGVRLG